MRKNNLPVQIKWHPQKNSKLPLYQQIINFICDKITCGEWTVGTRLPTQRQMAESFNVNRSTIVTAMEELASYGIITGSRRSGTEIISNTWSLILSKSLDWGKYVDSGTFKANKRIIQMINRLEFEPGMSRLSTGEVDPRLFPSEMWNKILLKLSKKNITFNYLEAAGLLSLRCSIARHLQKQGIIVSPANILITSGSLQALQLISVCLLKSSSIVYAEAPSYLQSLQVFQSSGIALKGISMDKNGIEFWKLPALSKNINQENISFLYTIPTNHNPTGITMSAKRRRDLIDFCANSQLPIIEDAAYQELYLDGQVPQPLKALDKNGIVIYIGTASKTLAPGLRIGWLIAPEPVIQRLSDVKMQMDYGTSSISQFIFAEFLDSGLYDEHLAELKKHLIMRRNNALSVLQKYFHDIAFWNVPSGGFYIWLTFRKKLPWEKLFLTAVQEKILLNPGNIYDFCSNNSLRISYSYLNCAEFEHAAEKLSHIIKNMLQLHTL